MRGNLLFAAALCAVLLVPAPASAATGDFIQCDVALLTGFDDDSFSGPASWTDCEYSQEGHGGSFGGGGWDASLNGTWTASSCGVGRVAGHITVTPEETVWHPTIDVAFDVPTTGGAGGGTATVTGEAAGSGTIVVAETATQGPCPKAGVTPIRIEEGPVEAEIGGHETSTVPALHTSFVVPLD
jgi:hypothetical protein